MVELCRWKPRRRRRSRTSSRRPSVFLPALRTELRRPLRLVAALLAGALGAHGLAALGAALAALGLRAAALADRAGDVADVALLGPVHGPGLLMNLLARGLGLRGGHLLVEVGRAALAEAGLLVPADRLADPVSAARALLEDRRDL